MQTVEHALIQPRVTKGQDLYVSVSSHTSSMYVSFLSYKFYMCQFPLIQVLWCVRVLLSTPVERQSGAWREISSRKHSYILANIKQSRPYTYTQIQRDQSAQYHRVGPPTYIHIQTNTEGLECSVPQGWSSRFTRMQRIGNLCIFVISALTYTHSQYFKFCCTHFAHNKTSIQNK